VYSVLNEPNLCFSIISFIDRILKTEVPVVFLRKTGNSFSIILLYLEHCKDMLKEIIEKAQKALNEGNYSEAVNFYTRAIELDKGNPVLYSERGVAYFHLKQKVLALADMDYSVALEPEYGYRYSSRAYIKEAMGDTHGAIEDYQMAVALEPDDGIAYNNLGLLQEKLGFMAQAKQNFSKADSLGLPVTPAVENKNVIQESKMQISEGGVIKNVLTRRKSLKEFIRFVRHGFRLK
jgi:tetratricopeptide (TPR) repeat protein